MISLFRKYTIFFPTYCAYLRFIILFTFPHCLLSSQISFNAKITPLKTEKPPIFGRNE